MQIRYFVLIHYTGSLKIIKIAGIKLIIVSDMT